MPKFDHRRLILCRLHLFIFLAVLMTGARCNSANPAPSTPPLPPTPGSSSIVVALLAPTSGELNTVGRQLRQGAIMAFDRWNEVGGINGHPIVWRVYDTSCDYESGQMATAQAIADGIRFIIGPLCSEAAIGAAVAVEGQPVLLIAPTATHPLVTVTGDGQTRRTVFRISNAFPQEGQAAARFSREKLAVQRAALLIPTGDQYAAATATGFAQAFVDLGGQLVYEGQYDPAQGDPSAALTTLIAAEAQLIYMPDPAAVAPLEASLQTFTPPPQLTLLGGDRWSQLDLPSTAKPARYITTQLFLNQADPIQQAWIDDYQAGYAIAPDTLAVLGYDAAHVLAQALQQTDPLDAARLAVTLAQGEFEALTGPIRFDPQHNPLKPIPVVQLSPIGAVLTATIR